MKKNRSSAAHAAEMTFRIGSPYSDFGGGKPRPVIVRKAGLTAAEVVELASLDRVSTGDLTSSEKERLDGLRVRRSSFGLANMRAALTEAYGAVDYYRAALNLDARCASNPGNYANHYPTVSDPVYFDLVKEAATAMDALLKEVAAGRGRASKSAALRNATKVVAMETEPARLRLAERETQEKAERMNGYERIRGQTWRRGAKRYRVLNQRWSAMWLQLEEIATRKRHWEFLPQFGPGLTYRPEGKKSVRA